MLQSHYCFTFLLLFVLGLVHKMAMIKLCKNNAKTATLNIQYLEWHERTLSTNVDRYRSQIHCILTDYRTCCDRPQCDVTCWAVAVHGSSCVGASDTRTSTLHDQHSGPRPCLQSTALNTKSGDNGKSLQLTSQKLMVN